MEYVDDIIFIFAVSSLGGAVIPIVFALIVQPEKRIEISVILFALALIGACAGVAGGMSRDPAVGSIIPAFLGLLGGVAVYLFGVDQSKGLIASLAASSLALSLIFAYTISAQFRNIGDDIRDVRRICAQAYTDPDILGDTSAFERFEAEFKQRCEDAMKWHRIRSQ